MAFGGSKLGVAKTGLLFEQNARHPHIDRHEHTASQLEIVQYALMKGLQLPRPFTGELIPVLDFPASKFHQVLVDDVADMFEVDGERDDFHGATTVLLIKALAR